MCVMGSHSETWMYGGKVKEREQARWLSKSRKRSKRGREQEERGREKEGARGVQLRLF